MAVTIARSRRFNDILGPVNIGVLSIDAHFAATRDESRLETTE